ncbi:hypothetical protein [Allocoleopsis franciscana]|uniref:Uncharacterized protein n=1 Tax=Allocoleopsis franciscana PCC 7113 TaxID=1173027 RepID=K9WJJ8_9CYAN|nr:hypothetical protein [Allocoleopsis franciscana]AFZ19697.1 hypothetical protein Mic7113_3992 [Allocoleopsis franciscana PCC 7113]
MTINFNPNLLPNDAPSDELIAEKLGALLLGDPDAFQEEVELSISRGWDAATFNLIFDDDEEDEGDEVEVEAA